MFYNENVIQGGKALKKKNKGFGNVTTVQGASRYLNTATLTNLRGTPAVQSTVLGEGSGTAGLLDAARVDTGIGLSQNARALTRQFLDQSASGFNTIFSLNSVEFGTTETLQQKILALRAGVPESQLAPSLRGDVVDEEA